MIPTHKDGTASSVLEGPEVVVFSRKEARRTSASCLVLSCLVLSLRIEPTECHALSRKRSHGTK